MEKYKENLSAGGVILGSLIAQAGPQGKTGKDGYTPIKGVDYYTDNEAQEIIQYITNAIEEKIEPQEQERQSNEQERITRENTRIEKEINRQDAELTRNSNEEIRQNNENMRETQESKREEAENRRMETFSQIKEESEIAIGRIEDMTDTYNKNAADKTNDFNNNSIIKTEAFNTNAVDKTYLFNQNAVGKMNEFNQNAADKITEFNENAQVKLNEYNANAEELTDIRVAADGKKYSSAGEAVRGQVNELKNDLTNLQISKKFTGNIIAFDTTSSSVIVEAEEETEITRSNKNILEFPYSFATATDKGVRCVVNADGSVTVTGTATEKRDFYFVGNSSTQKRPIKKGKYSFSGCPKGGSNSTYKIMVGITGEGEYTDYGDGITFDVSNDGVFYLRLLIYAGASVDFTIFPQLEIGESCTEWVMHQGETKIFNAGSTDVFTYDGINVFYAQQQFSVYVASKTSEYIEEKLSSKIDIADKTPIANGYSTDSNNIDLWQQGHYTSSSGTAGDPASVYYTSRIRTIDFIDSSVEFAECDKEYRFNVFKYSENGTFIYKSEPLMYFKFDHAFKYKIQLAHSVIDGTSIPINVNECNNVKFYKGSIAEHSPFDKSVAVNLSAFPISGYYKGQSDVSTGFNENTTFAEYTSAIDALVSAHSDYITKTSIGESSDGQQMYKLTLKPTDAYFDSVAKYWNTKSMPKVIIICGQHGFEKGSVFGLYYFIRDLAKNSINNPVLDVLRNNVCFEIIPITNPFGFDNMKYWNANGVNLNRNYDTEGFPYDASAVPFTEQYGGVTAFDQPETQYVRNLIKNNLDAYLFLDWHTIGASSVSNVKQIQWLSYKNETDPYYIRMAYAGSKHIRTITEHFKSDYNIVTNGNPCGSITVNDLKLPYASSWVTNQHILGMTFESCCGFPNMSVYTDDVIKANAEMMGNYIASIFNEFST